MTLQHYIMLFNHKSLIIFHFRNDVVGDNVSYYHQCFILPMAYDKLLLFKECLLFLFLFLVRPIGSPTQR